MDAADATPFGSWATVRGYFTPATLFLVLNLVIGTIALTSRSHQRRRREHHDYAHHLQMHYQAPIDPHHQEQQQEEYHYYQPQPQYATPPPAPLARTSSVLDRLRSIGLYRFRSGDFPPEYGAGAVPNHDVFAPVEETTTLASGYARGRSEPAPAREEKKRAPPRMKKPAATEVRKAQVARPPASSRVVEVVAGDEAVVDARADEYISGLKQPEPVSPPKADYHYQEEYVPPPAPMRAPPPLSRTSSVLDRLRSLGLYSFLGAEQPAAAAATDAFMTVPVDDKKHYDRSRSEPAREQGKKEKKQAAEAKMAKSSSAARKTAAPGLVEEECVDARAEAFIDSFRRGQSQKQVHHDDDEEHAVVPPPVPLARTSSVLDRLRSFSLYLRSGDAAPEDHVNKASAADEKKQAQYGRSRSEPAREQGAKKKQGAAAKMSKTSSVAAAAGIAEEAAPAEECVDARADDFINKFRQQLQLQRLNSLLGGGKQ